MDKTTKERLKKQRQRARQKQDPEKAAASKAKNNEYMKGYRAEFKAAVDLHPRIHAAEVKHLQNLNTARVKKHRKKRKAENLEESPAVVSQRKRRKKETSVRQKINSLEKVTEVSRVQRYRLPYS